MPHAIPAYGDPTVDWRISSFSGATDCVAVAQLGDAQVGMRSTVRPQDGVMTLSQADFGAFLERTKAGEFDALTS
jgi:hypothetical protein